MQTTSKSLRPSLFLVLLMSTVFGGQLAQASVVVVGTCVSGHPQFTTIQAAVNASAAGGTIYVCPGTYPEQVTITKRLTISGHLSGTNDLALVVPPAGGLVQNGTDIFGNPVAAQVFVTSAAGSANIQHLTVDATGNNLAGCGGPTLEGIYFQGASGVIANNVVRNQFQTDFASYGGCQNGLAINVESLSSSTTVAVSENTVRAYQKNGITATGAATGVASAGPSVTISDNYIVGLAATAANWTTPGAAENGIQVGYGATAKISSNVVLDNIWGPDTSSDSADAASGILIFASPGVAITANVVGSAQFGIAAVTDSVGFCTSSSVAISCGTADSTTISSNRVVGTQIFDAIDVCSNGNTVQSNSLFGSTESGVHLDDSCTNSTLGTVSGNNNTVSKNAINEACAGILLGTGTGNTLSLNTTSNVSATTLGGDVCPALVTADMSVGANVKQGQSKQRPSPYRPRR